MLDIRHYIHFEYNKENNGIVSMIPLTIPEMFVNYTILYDLEEEVDCAKKIAKVFNFSLSSELKDFILKFLYDENFYNITPRALLSSINKLNAMEKAGLILHYHFVASIIKNTKNLLPELRISNNDKKLLQFKEEFECGVDVNFDISMLKEKAIDDVQQVTALNAEKLFEKEEDYYYDEGPIQSIRILNAETREVGIVLRNPIEIIGVNRGGDTMLLFTPAYKKLFNTLIKPVKYIRCQLHRIPGDNRILINGYEDVYGFRDSINGFNESYIHPHIEFDEENKLCLGSLEDRYFRLSELLAMLENFNISSAYACMIPMRYNELKDLLDNEKEFHNIRSMSYDDFKDSLPSRYTFYHIDNSDEFNDVVYELPETFINKNEAMSVS